MARKKRKRDDRAASEPQSPARPRLTPSTTNRFLRDVARMKKRGLDMEKFKAVIEALCSRETLGPERNDHALVGQWKGWRDCHVAPDWIILYQKSDNELLLARTGTHADLFKK